MSKGTNVTLGVMLAVVMMLMVVGGSALLSGQARTEAEEKTTTSFVDEVSCSLFPFLEQCESGEASERGDSGVVYILDSPVAEYNDFEASVLTEDDIYSTSVSSEDCDSDNKNCKDIRADGKRYAVAVQTAQGDDTYGNGDTQVTFHVLENENPEKVFIRNTGANAWALERWALYREFEHIIYSPAACLSTDPDDCGGFSGDSSRTESVTVDLPDPLVLQGIAVQTHTADLANAGTDSRVSLCKVHDGDERCYYLDNFAWKDGGPYDEDIYDDRQRGHKNAYFREKDYTTGNLPEENLVLADGDEVYIKIHGDDMWRLASWTLYVFEKEMDYSGMQPYRSDGWICLSTEREPEGWCEGSPNNEADNPDRTPPVEIGTGIFGDGSDGGGDDGGDDAGDGTGTLEGDGTFRIRVVERGSDQPIEGANVILNGGESICTTEVLNENTPATGAVERENLDLTKSYSISLSKSGCQDVTTACATGTSFGGNNERVEAVVDMQCS